MKSKGFGDTVAKITKATGIKKVVEKVSAATGKDCGCSKRQDTLNRVFPYKKYKKWHIKNYKQARQSLLSLVTR